MLRITLLFSALAVLGQAVNSSPSSSFPTNATPITTVSPPATVREQAIEQIVPPQGAGAVSQSTNPSAIAVAQAATALAPTATLSAFARSIPNGQSSTLMWSSTNAKTCSGTGFSASGASGSLTVTPSATTTYGITCTGSGGSASQSVTVAVTPAPRLAVGMTVQSAGPVAMHQSPSMSAPLVGAVAPGSKGGIIGGPASADGSTWWEVSYKDGLARWAVQDDLMQASAQASVAPPTVTPSASPTSIPKGQSSAVQNGLMQPGAQASQAAPTVTLSASPTSMPNGQSSTLTWTSANATACSGTGKGFSPSGPSGSLAVSPSATTTYGITCTGAGGSASQSVTVAVTAAPTLAIGMTVAATGTIYAYSTPSKSTSAIGFEASGNQGVVIGGPASANAVTWWQVAFNDDLTGWTYQSGPRGSHHQRRRHSRSARILASVAPGASSTLSWSSTNATSCSGAGFSPSGASGSLSVSPTVSTTYSITCTGSGGSTTRISGGDREPSARLHLESVAPGHFQQSGDRSVRRHGDSRPRLHGRKFVCGNRRLGRSSARECLRPPAPKSCGSILRRAAGSKTRISISR